jgi:hypothetical protein
MQDRGQLPQRISKNDASCQKQQQQQQPAVQKYSLSLASSCISSEVSGFATNCFDILPEPRKPVITDTGVLPLLAMVAKCSKMSCLSPGVHRTAQK